LGFRFIYGIRNVTPFVIGASRLSPLKFFILNFLGALIWAVSFGLIGYQFGDIAERVMGDVAQYQGYLLMALVAIGLFLFWRSGQKREE
jgi:membrane protein DedA with SNARE-associated domain